MQMAHAYSFPIHQSNNFEVCYLISFLHFSTLLYVQAIQFLLLIFSLLLLFPSEFLSLLSLIPKVNLHLKINFAQIVIHHKPALNSILTLIHFPKLLAFNLLTVTLLPAFLTLALVFSNKLHSQVFVNLLSEKVFSHLSIAFNNNALMFACLVS